MKFASLNSANFKFDNLPIFKFSAEKAQVWARKI